VQYVDDLANTNWTDMAPDIVADGPMEVAPGTTSLTPKRFYRIVLLAP
jgi:hypothetical protein